MNKKLAAVGIGLAAALGALSTAAPALADTGEEAAVVDHEDDGERQMVKLNDVNQDHKNTHGPIDAVRERILQTFASLPTPASGALGPAGETQPGFMVMSEIGLERIED
ncbi:hypothetical protein ACIGQE_28030 [Streptomyces sp. NPDC053429]|uniref:hypothetical protein n=1 Tax=Streptomyces sp. NPDC053429 TaxID=3365702 RepID=UPI0037CCD9F5